MRNHSSFRRRSRTRKPQTSVMHTLFRYTLGTMALVGIALFWLMMYRWGMRFMSARTTAAQPKMQQLSGSNPSLKALEKEVAALRAQVAVLSKAVAHDTARLSS